jgi:hypothetical protein
MTVATWSTDPGSGAYVNGANWNLGVSPGASDAGDPAADSTAYFGTSKNPTITFSFATTYLGDWIFNPGTSAYTFTVGSARSLIFTNAGITVDGGSVLVDIISGGQSILTITAQRVRLRSLWRTGAQPIF